MKTASVQHYNTLDKNNIVVNYQFDLSKLTNITTYIMKKLTNVSPFLMLLVPVFMMIAVAFSTSSDSNTKEDVMLKSTPSTAVAKTMIKK